MKTQWKKLAAAAAVVSGLGITASPALARDVEDPFDRESRIGLRCWYRSTAPDTDPLDARRVTAGDFVLRGKWDRTKWLYKESLFYTAQEPEELREACENTLAGMPDAGELITWYADQGGSYNQEIWHEGEIASRRGQPIERIVAFGDSLSDTGNAYNFSEWTFPHHKAWFLGRFSNGRVWTEYLAEKTGLSLNTWANGGARGERSKVFFPGIEGQVDSFLGYMKDRKQYDPSRTLFTVWIGANDAMENGRADISTVRDIMATQWKALKRLSEFGARKILMVNLPDISLTPSYRDGGDRAALVHDVTRTYNDWLPTFAARFEEETGTAIQIVDIAKRFEELVANPEGSGFADAKASCLAVDGKAHPLFAYTSAAPLRPGCTPGKSVFWDLVHPSTAVHKMLADWALDATPEEWGLR